ncbi:helix-turn-helix domain-containing protein [Guptibacillus hwajinpoensis]|uniref:helix-turn-helix domain-containing protein n=1 Tax=Guptibacillus hwajinpoensis TaxID=208199 RepID=UPI00384AA7EB
MIKPFNNGLLLMRKDKLQERSWRSDNCYKFIFSHQGSGLYETPRGDISIDKGQFYILNPGDTHRQLNVTDEKFLIELDETIFQEVAKDLNLSVRFPEFASIPYHHPQLQQWASFVRDCMGNGLQSEESTYFLEHSAVQLVILMLKHAPGLHQQELPIPSAKFPLTTAITAMKEGFQEDWSLEQLANLTGLSKYQFAHSFKEALGISPYSFLQLYRIMKSQDKLLHSSESILSIAFSSGFKNLSSYNHLFKKLYGKSPSQFRSSFYKIDDTNEHH